MPEIKERPILFSAPMVRAILEGRKTVARRAVKASKAHADGITLIDYGKGWWPYNAFGDFSSDHEGMEYPIACPYGRPGDRLWVRETFAIADKSGSHDAAPDDHWRPARPGMEPEIYRCWYRASDGHTADGFWKPSIHMPRWASRILLEITDVRVERLQDISEAQAIAEGIVGVAFRPDDGWPICTGYMVGPDDGKTGLETTAAKAFAGLWDSVGGDWEANPWVWVVEFKRVTP